ncbi:MAG: nucleotidyltransferase family protein [Burkholderiales bacterium]
MSILAQAIVLAAGRGVRMGALTDVTPKPLLQVRGKPLMQWHLEALAHGGLARVVVNTAWLGAQIPAYFSNLFDLQPPTGKRLSLSISYSNEGVDFGHALETAGGIARALPQLDEMFWAVAGDVFAPDFVFAPSAMQHFAGSGQLAHLWLVPNPAHHLAGDFGLAADGLALNAADTKFTFSGIALYRRALFAPPWCLIPFGNPGGTVAPLAALLRTAMDNGKVSASLYAGAWTDVGTPERLIQLNTHHASHHTAA